MARGVNLETLTREFREARDKVWVDESIPVGQKRERVDQLWREFDSQRRALQMGVLQGDAGGDPVSGVTGRRMIFQRNRRPYWK